MTGTRPTVPTLPVSLLRDAVARETTRYSLRRVAREAALSPNGVRDFILGSKPRGTTRAKLERWLAAQGQVTRPPNVGQFVRLVNELSGELSPQQSVDIGRQVAELLVAAYQTRRLSPPCWVQDLLRHYRPGRRKVAGDVA